MKSTKNVVTGLIFTATLALSLLASGGDAYAKVRGAGGHHTTVTTTPIANPAPTTTQDLLEVLGVTWE
jgi:hypothetical protein